MEENKVCEDYYVSLELIP